MITPEKPFDPYQNAWRLFETGGLSALTEREFPLFVHDVGPNLTEAVGLDPATQKLGFMVLADAFPLDPDPINPDDSAHVHHLNVIARRPLDYDQITEAERCALDKLTYITAGHVSRVLRPAHGVAVVRFGQQVPTAHNHVIARRNRQDGLDWTIDRSKVDVGIRRIRERSLAFLSTQGLVAATKLAIDETLRRFAD